MWGGEHIKSDIVRLRAGLIPLGLSPAGRPSRAMGALCPCCRKPLAGTLQHLVECEANADIMHRVAEVNMDSWRVAQKIFGNDANDIEVRVHLISDLVKRTYK